jgi:transaldolase
VDAVISRLNEAGVSVLLDEPGVSALARVREEGPSSQGLSGLSLGPLSLRQALREQPGSSLSRSGAPALDLMVPYAQDAADLFRAVYDSTDGAAGRISIGQPFGPELNCDTIVATASELWAQTSRPNIQVRIPATKAGLAAAAELLAEGIGVDIALIYSAEQLLAAMAAIAEGFGRVLERGRDLSLVAATASFGVCEMDTEVDKLLWGIGSDVAGRLRGSGALANAYLAYAAYQTCLSDEHWRKLTGLGVRAPQLTWTSVQVRDPYYAEAKYVQALAAQGTAVSLNERTADILAGESVAFGPPLGERRESARLAMDALAEVGVDCNEVAGSLATRAAQALAASWDQLTAAG